MDNKAISPDSMSPDCLVINRLVKICLWEMCIKNKKLADSSTKHGRMGLATGEYRWTWIFQWFGWLALGGWKRDLKYGGR